MRLFRLNIEVRDLDEAAKFYGALLAQEGRLQAGARCYFTTGEVTLPAGCAGRRPAARAQGALFRGRRPSRRARPGARPGLPVEGYGARDARRGSWCEDLGRVVVRRGRPLGQSAVLRRGRQHLRRLTRARRYPASFAGDAAQGLGSALGGDGGMEEVDGRQLHDNIGLLGIRAQATMVGLVKLADELVQAGVLPAPALDQDAIVRELSAHRPPASSSRDSGAARDGLDALFAGDETVGELPPRPSRTRQKRSRGGCGRAWPGNLAMNNSPNDGTSFLL